MITSEICIQMDQDGWTEPLRKATLTSYSIIPTQSLCTEVYSYTEEGKNDLLLDIGPFW
jgi:hypothetical protein